MPFERAAEEPVYMRRDQDKQQSSAGSIYYDLKGRETTASRRRLCSSISGNPQLWSKLRVTDFLSHHRGCVNYVEFSSEGTVSPFGRLD